MKKLFISLVAFAVLFNVGCQENSVNDPLSTELSYKTQNSGKHGVIELQQLLNDPYPVGNSFYIISGHMEYQHSIVTSNPLQPSAHQNVLIRFSINAELKYFCTVCSPSEEDVLAGFIESTHEEYVTVIGHSLTQFDKTFVIQGREDGMVLKCRFFVNTRGMELSAMWLAFENNSITATINQ